MTALINVSSAKSFVFHALYLPVIRAVHCTWYSSISRVHIFSGDLKTKRVTSLTWNLINGAGAFPVFNYFVGTCFLLLSEIVMYKSAFPCFLNVRILKYLVNQYSEVRHGSFPSFHISLIATNLFTLFWSFLLVITLSFYCP